MKTELACLAGLVLGGSSALGQGQVRVVDASGGGAYSTIQAAIAASNDGDLVLVKTGTYASFTTTRLVSIVADTGNGVHVDGNSSVDLVGASSHVLLHRLRLYGGLAVQNSPGSVRIQGCLLQGWSLGLNASSSSRVGIVDSSITGGQVFGQSSAAVSSSNGSLALYGSDLHGGRGIDGPDGSCPLTCFGGSGGDGLFVSGASFAFAGAALIDGGEGGAGGDGCSPTCNTPPCDGGPAGAGIRLSTGTQTLWRFNTTTLPSLGGPGGTGGCGCDIVPTCSGDGGQIGPALVSSGDTVLDLTGVCPTLEVDTNPVRELGSLVVRVHTPAGNRASLLFSREAAFLPQANLHGVRMVASAKPWLMLGAAGATGVIEYGWVLPDLGPGVQSQILHLQAVIERPNGERLWSNPVELVVLDQAF